MNRHGWCPFIEKKEFEGEIKTFFCKKKKRNKKHFITMDWEDNQKRTKV